MQWPEETNAVAGGDTLWTLITRDCGIILNWVHLKKSRIIFFVIVTYWQSMARFRKNDFFKWAQKIKSVFCFIPHTHEGCDFTIRVYHKVLVVSIHTPTKGVTRDVSDLYIPLKVSIHTPTKGVTKRYKIVLDIFTFQSTHPRRVWPTRRWSRFTTSRSFNPHTHEGCDYCCIWLDIFWPVSIHTPTKGVTEFSKSMIEVIKVSIHTPTKGVTVWSIAAFLPPD